MQDELENGRVVHIEGNQFCVEKYYREYSELLRDSEDVLLNCIDSNFLISDFQIHIMDDQMDEFEFNERYTSVEQDSIVPGWKFMIRIYLEEKS